MADYGVGQQNDILPRMIANGNHRVFSINQLNTMEYRNLHQYYTYNVKCNYVLPDTLNQALCEESIPILSFNIGSMKSNFNSFVAEILNRKLNFGVIGLCETHLTNATENIYHIPNYKLFTSNVSSGKGGVCVYVHDEIGCKLIPDFSIITEHLETVFLEVIINKRVLIIGMIYRRPGTQMPLFQEDLSNILENIHSDCILMGDLNINLLNQTHDNNINNFVNNLIEFSYIPVILKPTRIQNNTATLLDHVWVNFKQNDGYNSHIIYSCISDHFPTIFHYRKEKLQCNKKVISFRKKGDAIDAQFKIALNNSTIDDVLGINEVNDAFELFNNTLFNLYDEYYSLKQKQIDVNKTHCPWITAGIKESIKRKNKLYKKFVKYPIT